MSVVAVSMMGRFGNQCFQYVYARAYAEKYGHEFQCDSWDGQKIFQLNDKPIAATNLQPRDENNIIDGEGDIIIRSYCQQQKCLIYTASQVREWFSFQEWVDGATGDLVIPKCCGHRRVGDYVGYLFPYVSEASYHSAARKYNLPPVELITEESPRVSRDIPKEISYLADFFILSKTPILLRGNSSFSWWASVLNAGITYSPVIDGLGGGEHNCDFVLGNHPRLSHHHFCTDLYLKKE